MNDIAVAIPVRSFSGGKTRLMSVLSEPERHRLIEVMLDRVIRTVVASGVAESVSVVSGDAAVLEYADSLGSPVSGFRQPDDQPGLLTAASLARQRAIERHSPRWLFLFGDLPILLPADVQRLAAQSAPVVIATDWTGTGTNGLMLSLDDPRTHRFGFAYGPDSRWLHEAEANRLGTTSTTISIEGVAHDLDTAEDVHALNATGRELPPELRKLAVWQQETIA